MVIGTIGGGVFVIGVDIRIHAAESAWESTLRRSNIKHQLTCLERSKSGKRMIG